MGVVRIDSLDDPRIAAYRCLKERELAREGERFIAEGEHLLRRLLASDYPVESVMLAERRAEEMASLAPPEVPVYVAAGELIHQIIGYKFHSGVIACGRRKPSPSLEQIVASAGKRLTLVVCPELNNAENLGSIIRISAAFGVDAMILGPLCCDPFWRQSVRVSMGTVFSLPIVRSKDLTGDLRELRQRWGVELAATVLAEDAEPLAEATRGDRLALLLGSEAQGLSREQIEACDRRVTIPMKMGTDSLNVAVAAGVFLYHFTREEKRMMNYE